MTVFGSLRARVVRWPEVAFATVGGLGATITEKDALEKAVAAVFRVASEASFTNVPAGAVGAGSNG
jgi:hypothetical protein